jgi:thiol-disulfide isomerase/thioredoxin
VNLPLWFAFLGLWVGPSIKSGPYPLRFSDCEERSPVVTTLDRGQPVTVKFRLGDCVLVGVAVGGKAVDGYVAADAIDGLEEFERARRNAPPPTARVMAPEPSSEAPALPAAGVRKEIDDIPPIPRPGAFDLSPGAQIPDFAFTDFEGRQRRLSEFSGHYLLITFWASWFPPSLVDIPYWREASTRFRGRGLELLSLNDDDEPGQAKPLLRAENILWTQAARSSVRQVMYKQFRVISLPAAILLDPRQRVVVSIDEGRQKLRGTRLFDTLEKALPRFE